MKVVSGIAACGVNWVIGPQPPVFRGIDRHGNRTGAIVGGNAGGDTLSRLDGNGERGFMPGRVV